MSQAALGVLRPFRPRVAEVNVNALHPVFRRKYLFDVADVVACDHHVFHRLAVKRLFNVAARVAQHVAGDIHHDVVDLRIIFHHRGGGNALAATQFQIERPVLFKLLPPMAAFGFRLVGEIRADGQLRLRPFFGAHVHG